MRVKATTGFSGHFSMARGEVRDVSDDMAEDLLRAGYVQKIKISDEKDEESTEEKTSDESGEDGTEVKTNGSKRGKS